MYSVLIPVDENEERAFHQAKYAARLPDATESVRATVLYVVPPEEFSRAEEVAFAEREAAVRAADYLEEAGIAVERVVEDGGVPQEIVRVADERDVDEIVMGGRKRSGVAQALLGSTVQDVIVSVDRPVTVTGVEVVFGEGMRHVLLPVDRGTERARRQAAYVAGLPGATDEIEVTVCYVFPHQDYKGAPSHEFEEVEAAVEAADRLEADGIEVDRVAVGGEVTRKILELAEDRDVDGIVMGGRKRSGVQKVLLGSTTQDVVLSVDRPVTIAG